MRTVHFIIIIVSIFLFHNSSAQTDSTLVHLDKFVLKKNKIARDSALSTHPLIASVRENIPLQKMEYKKTFQDYSVDFYPDHKKGVFYLHLNGVGKSPRTRIYLADGNGIELHSIKAKTRLNEVNLRKLPPGKYFLTVDVNAEITTWEILKE